MSDGINIQIKKVSRPKQQDIKKALNLNQVLAQPSRPPKKKRCVFWVITSILLAVALLALAAKIWLDGKKDFSSLKKVIPQEASAIFLLKTSQLNDLLPQILPELEQSSNYFSWLKGKIDGWLKNWEISTEKDIAPVINQEIAFFVFPSGQGKTAWSAIIQIRPEALAKSQILLQNIEQNLRKDYGLNESSYRQIKITSAYSFNEINKPYFWSRINDFVILSNDQQAMQKTIDGIIGK